MKTESRVNAGSITARVVADVDFVSNNHARIIYVLSSTIPLPPPCFVSFTVASIARNYLASLCFARFRDSPRVNLSFRHFHWPRVACASAIKKYRDLAL